MALTSLPEEIKASLESGISCIMVTCSKDGVPNTTVVSKLHWVDPSRVAVSFQFFSKTIQNVRENPRAAVQVVDLGGYWNLELEFDHSETEGPIFDELDMQIEAIASMTGMSGIFKLKAADIYRVLGVERISRVPA